MSSDEKARAQEPTPYAHNFFDSHPGFAKTRSTYLKTLLLQVILITVTTWGVLAIYWGALWIPSHGVHKLNGWIVDFDGGAMGQVVRQAFLNATGPKSNLDWRVIDPSMFPGGQSDLPGRIVDERAWVAVAISSGATARLQAAIAARDSTYNGTSAITAYAAEGRNENAFRDYLMPQTTSGLGQAMSAFALKNAMMLGPEAGALLASAPTTILSPMNYTIDNVRPFDIQVTTAVDFVGLIYLLILSFIAALGSYMARNMATNFESLMKPSHLLSFRLIVPFIVYLWLSLAYTLLTQFFLVPFDRHYGAAGWIIMWMLQYCGMLALGLAVEAMVTILTPKFVSFFLVLWIIVNVSVSFYPVEILPSIYRYGYAMPFYNVSRGVRSILLRTRNQLGLNFGVLIAWILISCITIPVAQYLTSRKELKEERQKQRGDRHDAEAGNRDSDATRV